MLQVEGASIDKRDHAADACGQIGELLGMDDAIAVAQEFQRTHPDTLILVSADHSHTSQIIPVYQTPRGAYTTLQTVDGQPIRIAYGTAAVTGSQAHTGATVPVFASGPRAADIVGTIDQTELFPVLTNTQAGDGPATPTVVPADVGGSVPATLALTTGAAASFGAFQPGVAQDYTASLQANVVSSAANATLSVADPSATATGHLVNGSYSLATAAAGQGGHGRVRARSAAAPRRRRWLTWTGPVSNDAVTTRLQAVDRRRRRAPHRAPTARRSRSRSARPRRSSTDAPASPARAARRGGRRAARRAGGCAATRRAQNRLSWTMVLSGGCGDAAAAEARNPRRWR